MDEQAEQQAPKIIFPCDYPIKIMGTAGGELQQTVMQIMECHAPGFDAQSISIRDSNKGNYQSITVTITATGTEQLQTIFDALKQSPRVKMVL